MLTTSPRVRCSTTSEAVPGSPGIRAALNKASPLRERVDRSAASQARCRSLEVAALG